MDRIQSVNIDQLNLRDHDTVVWPVEYAYDYMPTSEQHSIPLSIDLSNFPDLEAQSIDVKANLSQNYPDVHFPIQINEKINSNSIPVFPVHANLPWRSSIHHVRQSVHWRASIEATQKLLQLFASDTTANQVFKEGGKSYAEVAAIELSNLHCNWTRFNAYLWPALNEKRIRLIAETIVYIFIFDEIWEMSNATTIQRIQNEFVSRLKSRDSHPDDRATSELQEALFSTIQGLHEEDHIDGNGGADVAAALLQFINHPPPPTKFNNLREFLNYRIIDAAAFYTITCAKFSLCSSVELSSLRIANFLRLLEDHVAIANDLYSFAKEKKDYLRHKVRYLINTVEEVRKTFALADDESAILVTLAIQIEVEKAMAKELLRLNSNSEVTESEKELVNALVFLASGNIMTSITMSHYRV